LTYKACLLNGNAVYALMTTNFDVI